VIDIISSEISFYWQTLWMLLKTPFLHSGMMWGIVPLYFGWFMNELTSDKKSFNTATQSGFSFIWAGIHWSQIYFQKGGGLSLIFRNGLPTITALVTLIVLVIGTVAFISGIRKRHPKYCSFLGHARFANYFMIAIFAIQSNYLTWTWDRLIAMVGFSIPIWVIVHFSFKPIRGR
jgi:uncharacterized membrane protein YesL